MAKQFSKINFQVQTQLGLLDISAQSNTICRFFFFHFLLQINCSVQSETLLNVFLLLAQRFEWTHNQSATILAKYELIDK